jgi:signal transduction histidine kinase
MRVALAAVLLLITAAASWQIHGVVADRDRDRFDAEVARIDTAIEERMRAYVQVLRGGAAFFAGSRDVALTEWLQYVDGLRLDERYPGFKSLSFAPQVPRERLGAFVARARAQRVPAGADDAAVREYAVRAPVGARDAPAVASPILFVAPFVPENTRVLGIDMISEPVRRAAMLRARASGRAAASPRLKLSGGQANQSGFIVYVPLVRDGRFLGWLTAAFETERFMTGLLGRTLGGDVRLALSDGSGRPADAGLLWSTQGTARDLSPLPLPEGGDGALTRTSALQVPGQTWTARYASAPGFTSPWATWAPLLVLAGGGVLTVLLVLLSRASSRWRDSADLLAAQAGVLREARDAAQAADRAKATFLATMSHEIRTPMNAVVGMSSLLLRSPLDTEQEARARVIRESGEHLLGLINEILDVSKLEAGRIELEDAPLEVRRLVAGTVDLLGAETQKRDVTIDIDVAAGTPAWVRGDDGRLRQVLLNLLANAVHHSPDGSRVGVSVDATAVDDGWVLEFAVADRGPGIDPADHQRIFRPFEQGAGAAGGTGLGLPIARRLVEAMGGAISVVSSPGTGATFRFTVRAGRAEAQIRPAVPEPREAPGAGLSGLRVLVAEDNPLSQLMVRDALGQLDVSADIVGDGAEALAAVERQPYDVVLLDLHMPVLDGAATARRIVETVPAGQRPRIVAMTADVTAAARTEAAEAGMEDFVAKPVTAADLDTALRRNAGATFA